jgi:LacI family transcriptional regulator
MKNSRVTLSDLARSLDLSVCTVSKILNRSFDGFSYAPETIARVDAVAKKLGYRPNSHARSLRTRKSGLVGFILPTAQIALFGALTDRLEMELRKRGYQVVIAHSRNNAAAEVELIPEFVARSVDGLVWIPASRRVQPEKFGLPANFPVVILDRPGCTPAIPFVVTDNRESARGLAQRIYDSGHRCVEVINAPAGDRAMSERLLGIQDVFGQGVAVTDIANETEPARAATVNLCQGRNRPGLLFALSEPLAIGALSGLRDLDLRIPEDLSFAAFDDFPLASQWSPPVTVVRQNIEQLAATAADLVVRRIMQPRKRFPSVRIPASIEWRGSVATSGDAIHPKASRDRMPLPGQKLSSMP